MSRETFDPTKTPGAFEPPPPHAPRETAQPLSEDALALALERATANEQVLPPFNPAPLPAPQPMLAQRPVEAPRHQPAASNTDSPSRGIPREIADPGKRITGGFGHPAEAQYFPLDGSELKQLIIGLMGNIADRLQNDLRFHLAITYPRVRARVVVEVEAYAQGEFDPIEKIFVHDKTPLEVAREVADQVAFVIVEQRREMAVDGSAENPPDRIREELGLERPFKRQVDTPGGKMFVDRETTPLDGLF